MRYCKHGWICKHGWHWICIPLRMVSEAYWKIWPRINHSLSSTRIYFSCKAKLTNVYCKCVAEHIRSKTRGSKQGEYNASHVLNFVFFLSQVHAAKFSHESEHPASKNKVGWHDFWSDLSACFRRARYKSRPTRKMGFCFFTKNAPNYTWKCSLVWYSSSLRTSGSACLILQRTLQLCTQKAAPSLT